MLKGDYRNGYFDVGFIFLLHRCRDNVKRSVWMEHHQMANVFELRLLDCAKSVWTMLMNVKQAYFALQ